MNIMLQPSPSLHLGLLTLIFQDKYLSVDLYVWVHGLPGFSLFFLIWEGGGLSKLRDWVWNLAHCVDLRVQCSGASWGSPGALPGILKAESLWAVHNSNSRPPHKAIFLDTLALHLAPPDTRKWKECIHVFGEIVWVKKEFWKYKGKDSW